MIWELSGNSAPYGQQKTPTTSREGRSSKRSGEGGIRTPDDPKAIPDFESGAFILSATSPSAPLLAGIDPPGALETCSAQPSELAPPSMPPGCLFLRRVHPRPNTTVFPDTP